MNLNFETANKAALPSRCPRFALATSSHFDYCFCALATSSRR